MVSKILQEAVAIHPRSESSVGDVDDSLEGRLEERKRERSQLRLVLLLRSEQRTEEKGSAHNMERVLDELEISHQVLDLSSTEEL